MHSPQFLRSCCCRCWPWRHLTGCSVELLGTRRRVPWFFRCRKRRTEKDALVMYRKLKVDVNHSVADPGIARQVGATLKGETPTWRRRKLDLDWGEGEAGVRHYHWIKSIGRLKLGPVYNEYGYNKYPTATNFVSKLLAAMLKIMLLRAVFFASIWDALTPSWAQIVSFSCSFFWEN